MLKSKGFQNHVDTIHKVMDFLSKMIAKAVLLPVVAWLDLNLVYINRMVITSVRNGDLVWHVLKGKEKNDTNYSQNSVDKRFCMEFRDCFL